MKRLSNDPFIWLCIAAILFFSVHFISALWEESPAAKLNEAQMNYLTAERTTNIAERKAAFHRSLELLLELENIYAPTFGNGKLYFNLGNNFFQLEEYPLALLYYYQAEQLRPVDDKVQTHLALTLKKLGLSATPTHSAFDWLFFFHRHFSLPERLQFLAAFVLLTTFMFSGFLWTKSRLLYSSAMVAGLVALLFLCSVSYTYMLSPIEAVVIKSSLLYRDAGTQYAKVKREPLIPGSKVKLLDIALAGKWLKIKTDDGSVGYLPQEALRTISQ